MRNHHERHWADHPLVPSGEDLSFGDRAADWMKTAFGTWTAVGTIIAAMAGWMATDLFGLDKPPWIGLNLCLSCLAALQCFILLIAGKRQDAINSALQSTMYALMEKNTELTQEIHSLTEELHEHFGIPKKEG